MADPLTCYRNPAYSYSYIQVLAQLVSGSLAGYLIMGSEDCASGFHDEMYVDGGDTITGSIHARSRPPCLGGRRRARCVGESIFGKGQHRGNSQIVASL